MYGDQTTTVARGSESVLATNKVLRNTYMLLSLTLLFSGFTAWWGSNNIDTIYGLVSNPLLFLVGYFVLLFAVEKTADSGLGLFFVFCLTGYMGLTIAPIVYMAANSPYIADVVTTALGGTGIIFLGLSAYALISRKNFNFLGGMLAVGILVAFVVGLAAYAFGLPNVSLAVSGVFLILMSGLILFQTSRIIHGGETNYIRATVTLYVAIYNIFMSLVHILLSFAGGDD